MKKQVQTSHEPRHPARLSEEHGWVQAKPGNLCLSSIPAPVEALTEGSPGFLTQLFLQWCDPTLQCCNRSGYIEHRQPNTSWNTAETVGAFRIKKMKTHKDSWVPLGFTSFHPCRNPAHCRLRTFE